MPLRALALASSAALLLAACQPESADAPVPAEAPAASAAEASAVAAAAAPAPVRAAAPAGTQPAAKPTHPTLVLDTLDHGRFDLAQQRGQWVVVNFWATWCAPCLKEIPDLNALDAGNADVTVIGLAYEEITPEAMRAFYVAQVKPDYPVAILDVVNPPADFDTPRGLPFTVLLDPEGAVVHQFLGPVTGQDILDRIAKAKAAV